MRSKTIKILGVPGLSQVPCAWDTRLVSDAPGHQDGVEKQGRREKEKIDLFHALYQGLACDLKVGLGVNQAKLCMGHLYHQIWQILMKIRRPGIEVPIFFSLSLSLSPSFSPHLSLGKQKESIDLIFQVYASFYGQSYVSQRLVFHALHIASLAQSWLSLQIEVWEAPWLV